MILALWPGGMRHVMPPHPSPVMASQGVLINNSMGQATGESAAEDAGGIPAFRMESRGCTELGVNQHCEQLKQQKALGEGEGEGDVEGSQPEVRHCLCLTTGRTTGVACTHHQPTSTPQTTTSQSSCYLFMPFVHGQSTRMSNCNLQRST